MPSCPRLADTIKQRKSKALDMRCHWLEDLVRDGKFHICWQPGGGNCADCHSKHFPASVHQSIRPTRVRDLPQNANFFAALADSDTDGDSDDDSIDEHCTMLVAKSSDCSDSSSCAAAVVEGVLNPDRYMTVTDMRSGHGVFRHVITRDSFEDTDPSAHNFT